MSVIDLSPFNAILRRLETVADRLETVPGSGAGAAGGPAPAAAAAAGKAAVDDPPLALAFDAFLAGKLPPLEDAAKALAVKDITEATETFVESLSLLRALFVATGRCKKPQDSNWAKILGPVLELGQKAQKACDNRSEYFQNRKSAAEALNVVTLVTATSPPSHVQNVLETMDFHAIKVMQKKIEKETAWIKALKVCVKDLKDWCSEECKLGLTWKHDGQDPLEYFAASPLGAAPAGPKAAAPGKGKGKGPPIPKGGLTGPPPEVLEKIRGEGATAKADPAGGMAAVFNALSDFNTGSLKKVTSDMKTKNRAKDDAAAPAAAVPKAAPGKSSWGGDGRKGPKGNKPPTKELQKELNWIIENYDGAQDLTVDEALMTQVVVMINCRNSTLKLNSKVKSISIDGCEKVNLICQDVVSVVELVNSDKCQVQTTGKVHAFAIDKCNGVNVFLSKDSLAAEITSSKSSEMNVTIPDPDGDEGDIIEMPIPEQFVTTLAGKKKLKTEVSSLYTS